MSAALYAQSLRCEYRQNPVGLATLQPRLSWELTATQPNQIQTAYQIRVANSPDDLTANQALIWDTGQVMTAQSNQIVYEGPPLQSVVASHPVSALRAGAP